MECEVIYQLILATILGALIGMERESRGKEAGFRTFTLVTLGSCLLTIISIEFFGLFTEKSGIKFDPSGVIQAIAIGIGFIGAGVIFRQSSGIVGLTTAAGLWVTAAIGIAVGLKLYFLAIFTTFLVISVLAGFSLLEEKIFKRE